MMLNLHIKIPILGSLDLKGTIKHIHNDIHQSKNTSTMTFTNQKLSKCTKRTLFCYPLTRTRKFGTFDFGHRQNSLFDTSTDKKHVMLLCGGAMHTIKAKFSCGFPFVAHYLPANFGSIQMKFDICILICFPT